jgi:uncharacterized protein YecT (DUF1311 family)
MEHVTARVSTTDCSTGGERAASLRRRDAAAGATTACLAGMGLFAASLLLSGAAAGHVAQRSASRAGGDRLASSPGAASAAGVKVPPPSYDSSCMKTARTQLALDRCVAREVAELDAELAHAVTVQGGVTGAAGAKATEATWTKYMRSEWLLETRPNAGGSIVPLVYGDCEVRLLVDRISEIRAFVDAQPQ